MLSLLLSLLHAAVLNSIFHPTFFFFGVSLKFLYPSLSFFLCRYQKHVHTYRILPDEEGFLAVQVQRRHTHTHTRCKNCICFSSSWQAEMLLLAPSSHSHSHTPTAASLCLVPNSCEVPSTTRHTDMLCYTHTRQHGTSDYPCGHITDICVLAFFGVLAMTVEREKFFFLELNMFRNNVYRNSSSWFELYLDSRVIFAYTT